MRHMRHRPPMTPRRALMLALCMMPLTAALAGCERFPSLDAQLTEADRAAPYPPLVPLDGINARAAALAGTDNAGAASGAPRTGPQATANLAQRAAALRARAARLRGDLIEPETRRRMERGVATIPELQ